jgi:hypothetical protein
MMIAAGRSVQPKITAMHLFVHLHVAIPQQADMKAMIEAISRAIKAKFE